MKLNSVSPIPEFFRAKPPASLVDCRMQCSKWILCLFLVLVAGCAGPGTRLLTPLGRDMVPPRVAVATFENRTGFEGQWKLGPGMADLLVAELVASRNFVVLERGQLDRVVDEISRQRHRLFRFEGRVDEGRLDNAQYLIRGVISDFSQTSGGSLWMGVRRLLIGGGGYTARVGLTLTIVDVETGTIVDSVQSSGKARAGEAYVEADYKGVRFGGNAFFRTPLGQATTYAIREGLRHITRRMPRQPWRPMVAEVQGLRVVLNGGHRRGFRAGQYYQARKQSVPVTDPQTGDLLDMVPGAVVGLVRITEVQDRLSIAEKVSGIIERSQVLEPVEPDQLPE